MSSTDALRDVGALAEGCGDELVAVHGDASASVGGVTYDSRKVGPGDLFFCVPGTRADGHRFARDAVAAGAGALMVTSLQDLDVPQVVVRDARRAMARIAATFYGHPARGLRMLGVTGTNGKTTTAFLLEAILRAAGETTGLIGTIETRVAGVVRPGVRTTPESVDLQSLLAEMRSAGVGAVAMEVTSHALVLHRVEGIHYAAAAFTNLSQDHLDFHDGMEDYFAAKRSLFVQERTARGAVNSDDPYGRRLLETADIPVTSFGTAPVADVRAEEVRFEATSTTFLLRSVERSVEVTTPLVGGFNLSNCLAAAATAFAAGVDEGAVAAGLGSLRSVPGRFESIDEGQDFTVVVDYAHTPDSLDNVLRAAQTHAAREGGGRVICVFGCGGDRDRGKRPLMGAVAARLADVVVVTSDNPRSEEPSAIIDEILEGVISQRSGGPDVVEVEREPAIREAIARARPHDVVVIAGKGHETGQEFRDHTIPFDDREVASRVLRERTTA